MAHDRDQELYVNERRSRRIVISSWDAREAVEYGEALVSLIRSPEYTDGSPVRRALTLAMVVSYARPFSGNRESVTTDSSRPDDFVERLTTDERVWHDRVIMLRNRAFAHSDAAVAEVNLGTPGTTLPMPAMKDPRVAFTVDEAEQVLSLARRLDTWHEDALKRLGTFGVVLHRSGTVTGQQKVATADALMNN